MKGEIDKGYYCNQIMDGEKCNSRLECKEYDCSCRHRKWPTPEQFEEEYGEEWEGATYTLCKTEFCKNTKCIYAEWSDFPRFEIPLPVKFQKECEARLSIVCACTPWGKPPNTWRPE